MRVLLVLPLALLLTLMPQAPLAPGAAQALDARGYLKQVQAVGFSSRDEPIDLTALWTQRFEVEAFAGPFRLFWGQKTRLAHGDLLRAAPAYARALDATDDWVSWGFSASDGPDHVLHTVPDRLYAEWTRGEWQAAVGRQRIHWGRNLGWNPLDWFNAVNPLDFDDEERGGIDAALVQWYFSPTGALEAVVRPAEAADWVAAALLWRASVHAYDVQVQVGRLQDDSTALGAGWSGALGPAGFRGEYSLFFYGGDRRQHLFGVTVDYLFASELFVGGGFLYNSDGATEPAPAPILPGTLSVRRLNPARFNLQGNARYPVSPLLNADLYVFANPLDASAWLVPGLTCSLSQSVDVLLNAQVGVGGKGAQYRAAERVLNLRWKWNF